MKFCKTCNTFKELKYFCKKKSSKDGLDSQCKQCKANYQRKYRNTTLGKIANLKGYNSWRINNLEYKAYLESLRRAKKLKATPKWANLDKIKEIYTNCPKGYHVDHIIPLQGENICGLHIESNLQYLPAIENIRKSNKVIYGQEC